MGCTADNTDIHADETKVITIKTIRASPGETIAKHFKDVSPNPFYV